MSAPGMFGAYIISRIDLVPATMYYPDLNPPGLSGEPYEIITGTTPSCGYVVVMHVWDRTIRNNYFNGNYNKASVGFCLLD